MKRLGVLKASWDCLFLRRAISFLRELWLLIEQYKPTKNWRKKKKKKDVIALAIQLAGFRKFDMRYHEDI